MLLETFFYYFDAFFHDSVAYSFSPYDCARNIVRALLSTIMYVCMCVILFYEVLINYSN